MKIGDWLRFSARKEVPVPIFSRSTQGVAPISYRSARGAYPTTLSVRSGNGPYIVTTLTGGGFASELEGFEVDVDDFVSARFKQLADEFLQTLFLEDKMD